MLLLLPWVVPIVVSATSINYLVATADSPMPSCSSASGSAHRCSWPIPTWAKSLVCIYKVWVSFPFMMLMTSAALASVDDTVYEAARWTAPRWQQFPTSRCR